MGLGYRRHALLGRCCFAAAIRLLLLLVLLQGCTPTSQQPSFCSLMDRLVGT